VAKSHPEKGGSFILPSGSEARTVLTMHIGTIGKTLKLKIER
jgi:hypothetical protein